MSRRGKPKQEIKIAKERIDILFSEAKKRAKDRPELSDRYVEIARKIAMKYNIKMPKKYKRKFCKNCYSYLIPKKRSIHRTKNGKVTIKCKKCGERMRYSLNV